MAEPFITVITPSPGTHELWLVAKRPDGTIAPVGNSGPVRMPSAWQHEYENAMERQREAPPVRCKDCDLPNGCPEYCWCGPQGAGNAEYASWFATPTSGGTEGEKR